MQRNMHKMSYTPTLKYGHTSKQKKLNNKKKKEEKKISLFVHVKFVKQTHLDSNANFLQNKLRKIT